MPNLPLEKLLPRSNFSIYQLVRMASCRALELSEGRPSLIKNPTTDKVTTLALQEIFDGKIMSRAAANLLSAEELGERVEVTQDHAAAKPEQEEEQKLQEALTEE